MEACVCVPLTHPESVLCATSSTCNKTSCTHANKIKPFHTVKQTTRILSSVFLTSIDVGEKLDLGANCARVHHPNSHVTWERVTHHTQKKKKKKNLTKKSRKKACVFL